MTSIIRSVLAMDKKGRDYTTLSTPEEAIEFARRTVPVNEGLIRLVQKLNEFLPTLPTADGKRRSMAHVFVVGKDGGERILVLQVSKLFLGKRYAWRKLYHYCKIAGRHANADRTRLVQNGNGLWAFRFEWRE